MRLLWFGDLAPTGFGTVTTDAGRALLDLGVDVRFLSQNNYADLPEPFVGRTLDLAFFEVGPEGVENVRDFIPNLLTGQDTGQKLANGEPWGEWKPDACIMLGDYYAVRSGLVQRVGLDPFRSLPSFHYVPVEGDDLPPRWRLVWDVIKPIAMTKFGQDQIERVTGERPPLVYHGVDADLFHPVSPSAPITVQIKTERRLTSKAACKALLAGAQNIDQAYEAASKTWILRTDRNMPRKGYPALLRALAPVLAERPNTILYIHCRSEDQGGDLWDSISKLAPDIQRQIIVPDWGALERDALVALYNAADIYASTSAEGFGLTIAEAIACGVPAVALDYSAVPEVVGPAGVLAPVGQVLDNEYGHNWALPDEAEFGRRVAYLIDRPHKRVALGQQGPRHVRRNFSWAEAAKSFRAIVESALPSIVVVGRVAGDPEAEALAQRADLPTKALPAGDAVDAAIAASATAEGAIRQSGAADLIIDAGRNEKAHAGSVREEVAA